MIAFLVLYNQKSKDLWIITLRNINIYILILLFFN